MYKALIKHSRYSLAIDICWCLQVHHMALMQHGNHQTKALLRVNNAHFISPQTTTMITIHSYTIHVYIILYIYELHNPPHFPP